MKLYKLFITFFLISVIIAPGVYAQMAGNPVGVRGHGEWSISASGSYVDQDNFVSRRILMKSSWGVADWLDVFCVGGGAQLEMMLEGIDRFKGDCEFAYGLGFAMASKPFHNHQYLQIWGGVQALRFCSAGSYVDRERSLEFEMNYDWRELHGHFGIIYQVKNIRLYAAGVGWALQRIDRRDRVYALDASDERIYETSDPVKQDTYQTGFWSGGMFGVEFLFPMRYSINLECLVFNENNYQIRIGVCQTGILPW